MTPDLQLRAAVAVDVMNWKRPDWADHDAPDSWFMGSYELSRDACEEVLAEIERRGLLPELAHKLRDSIHFSNERCGPLSSGICIGLNATAADICRAALAAVREAKGGGK